MVEPVSAATKAIEVGEKAPAIRLKDQDGQVVRLSDFRGRRVVIYFYPEDDTPACITQACGFRDEFREFERLGVPVLGISPQGAASHRRFADKYGLKFRLLADEPGADGVPPVASAYGVWREKVLYGRRFIGLVRTTFLVGPDGRIERRWDNVRTKGHAQRVLEAIREIEQGAAGTGKRRTKEP